MDDATVTERIARAFHDNYEVLAPEFGYTTRKASAVPWEQVPENNKRLMIAVVAKLIEQHVIYPNFIDRHNNATGRGVDLV